MEPIDVASEIERQQTALLQGVYENRVGQAMRACVRLLSLDVSATDIIALLVDH